MAYQPPAVVEYLRKYHGADGADGRTAVKVAHSILFENGYDASGTARVVVASFYRDIIQGAASNRARYRRCLETVAAAAAPVAVDATGAPVGGAAAADAPGGSAAADSAGAGESFLEERAAARARAARFSRSVDPTQRRRVREEMDRQRVALAQEQEAAEARLEEAVREARRARATDAGLLPELVEQARGKSLALALGTMTKELGKAVAVPADFRLVYPEQLGEYEALLAESHPALYTSIGYLLERGYELRFALDDGPKGRRALVSALRAGLQEYALSGVRQTAAQSRASVVAQSVLRGPLAITYSLHGRMATGDP